jgi:hypothetical protein
LARDTSESFDAGARAELIGKIYDRLGDGEAAFQAFERMNRENDLSKQVIANRAGALRDLLDHRMRMVAGESLPETVYTDDRHEPAFLIGFPRSGTTLLDTFLMGHSRLRIAEERPMLQEVARLLGEYGRIASLDDADLRSMRDRYFEVAASHVPDLADRLLIDKLPLGAIDTPLIHRLFPTAKLIFALRHPCDVVLSCFSTRFQPTPTLISFNTIEDSAGLYDKVMSFWMQCRAAMPLDVEEIKYEELVADPEGQLRKLVAFLGIEWEDRILHHELAAQGRSFISRQLCAGDRTAVRSLDRPLETLSRAAGAGPAATRALGGKVRIRNLGGTWRWSRRGLSPAP